MRDAQVAARSLDFTLHIVQAGREGEFANAFADLARLRLGLVIGEDGFFNTQSEQLAALALRHALPAIYQYHEFAVAGGLISYGGSTADPFRTVGLYTGRILNGEKPADLSVQQATRVELILNLKTAKALGITMPPSLLLQADEVIQ